MDRVLGLKNFDVKKVPPKFYNGLTKLFYQLGINGHDVVEDFIYGYLDYASKQSSVKSDIYLSTGFGRRYLDKYLKKISFKQSTSHPYYYQSLITELKKLAEKSNNGVIPIYGKFNSYATTYEATKSRENVTSSQSMLKKLIRVGVLEMVDDECVRFITKLPSKRANNPDDVIRVLSNTMNRFCHTLFHNMNAQHNDELSQAEYWSNEIDTIDHQDFIDETNKHVREFMLEMQKRVKYYEAKGLARKVAHSSEHMSKIKQDDGHNTIKGGVNKTPEANNIELGISVFIFKNKS